MQRQTRDPLRFFRFADEDPTHTNATSVMTCCPRRRQAAAKQSYPHGRVGRASGRKGEQNSICNCTTTLFVCGCSSLRPLLCIVRGVENNTTDW